MIGLVHIVGKETFHNIQGLVLYILVSFLLHFYSVF